VGGVAVSLLSGLGMIHDHKTKLAAGLYPLALFGQRALLIYVGHAFVLPSLSMLDALGVVLEGPLRAGLLLLVFMLFIMLAVLQQHRVTTRKREVRELRSAIVYDDANLPSDAFEHTVTPSRLT